MFISRIVSGLVAVTYLVAAYADAGGAGVLACAAFLVLPLACIWFSETMGELSGIIRLHQLTAETPGWLVACGGWLVLLVPVIAVYLQQQVV
jgi:membrane protease YdiL (CAAX protease family)